MSIEMIKKWSNYSAAKNAKLREVFHILLLLIFLANDFPCVINSDLIYFFFLRVSSRSLAAE